MTEGIGVTDILLAVLVGLMVPSAVLHMVQLRKVLRHAQEQRTEDAVQAAMEEAAEEAAGSRRMDEGFENLMHYTVKLGHGIETGGRP